MTDLGSLGTLPDGASYSMAFGINNDGQAVGWAESPGPGGQHAVMWDNGHIVDIGALPLPSNISPYALAVAINDRGQVVGTSNTGPLDANGQEVSHAFLWQNGILIDLNDLLPPDAGWVLTSAVTINNAGQIVGTGTHDGQQRGFVLSLGHTALADAGRGPTNASRA